MNGGSSFNGHTMLFPLSKSFCSTRLFQTGGHHERPAKRVWTIDNTDLSSKARDLHRLIADKKPYAAHQQLARTYSEPQRLAMREHAKHHKTQLGEMLKRCEERAKEERHETHERVRQYNENKGTREADRKASFHSAATEDRANRDAMMKRVTDLPKIWGEAAPEESHERKRQRADAGRSMKQEEKRYFQEQRLLDKSLAESIVIPRRDPGDEAKQEALLAEKKNGMRQEFLAYETKVENIYKTHHERICAVQRGHKERHVERLARSESNLAATLASFSQMKEQGRKETEERETRMKNRGKCHGGYVPFHKSEKRLREELASAGGDLAMTA